jgi:hypothetical protein
MAAVFPSFGESIGYNFRLTCFIKIYLIFTMDWLAFFYSIDVMGAPLRQNVVSTVVGIHSSKCYERNIDGIPTLEHLHEIVFKEHRAKEPFPS